MSWQVIPRRSLTISFGVAGSSSGRGPCAPFCARDYDAELIEENKWRAVRHGLDGNLLDLGKEAELPARDLVRELIEWFVGDVVDELGSRKEVECAFKILQDGSSADRQLAAYQKTGDLKGVVDQLIRETSEGVVE